MFFEFPSWSSLFQQLEKAPAMNFGARQLGDELTSTSRADQLVNLIKKIVRQNYVRTATAHNVANLM